MDMVLHELVGRDLSRPFSPHCWKVRLALAHKGLPYRSNLVPFTGVASVENGTNRTVPTLRDGDRVIVDSFAIAEYLDDTYPEAPPLFGEPGGRGLARFVEAWSQRTIHPFIVSVAMMEIFGQLDRPDQKFFRRTREARLGMPLESVPSGRTDEKLAGFRRDLEPLRATLARQPFLGGASPLFADYIVFGAFQWHRIMSSFAVLDAEDPIARWFERCLDLHDGAGRSVPAAAA